MKSNQKSNKKSIYNVTGKVFILKLLGTALIFLFQIVMTNKMGKNLFGQFVVLTSTINIFLIISTIGIDSSLIRYIPRIGEENTLRKKILKASFDTVFILSLVVCLCMFFLKSYIVKIFGIQNQEYYFYVPIILFVMSLGRVLDGFLQGEKKTDVVNFLSPLLLTIFKFIIFFAIIFFSKSYLLAAILTVLISEAAVLILRIIYIFLEQKEIVPSSDSKFAYKEYMDFIRYSLSLFAISGVGIVVANIDKLIANKYVGASDVGIYKAADSYMALVGVVSSSLIVFWPVMSEMYKNNEMKKLESTFNRLVKIVSMIIIPIIVIMLIFSSELLSIFGKDFAVGSNVLRILLIGVSFDAFAGPVGALLNMTNYVKHNLVNNLVFAFIGISLNLILTSKFGIIGTAFSTAITVVLINLFSIVLNKLFLNVFPYDKNNLKLMLLGVILYFIDKKLYEIININMFAKMFIFGVISYIIYIIFCMLFLKIRIKDVKELIKF